MKPAILATLLLAAPALSACVIIETDEDLDDFTISSDHHTPAGTVYGAMIHRDHIEFLVTSNGCTDETYFEVHVDQHATREASVELDRIKTDPCKALIAEGTRVSWTFEELAIAPGSEVRIVNQVVRR
ncbi:MAG: hypothetical protein MRY64_13635 [Hyphomonadaceae bacterium]|nr:hypothetical protein [Hyphomonadaceae bacterium]